MLLVFGSFYPIGNMGSLPWVAISNSALKGNSLKKILTFIEIL